MQMLKLEEQEFLGEATCLLSEVYCFFRLFIHLVSNTYFSALHMITYFVATLRE
jgi:hypothetical protein